MKTFCFLLAMAFSPAVFSQALITYGNHSISKDEFLKAYNKNKAADADKEKALREYAELFTNFKLKVQAAKDLRIDTLSQLNYDIENFRSQVVENYLSDEKGLKRLTDEAHARSLRDLHVMHYSIPVSENNLADSVQASEGMQALYTSLKSGTGADVTAKYKIRQNDLGFITVFTVPYEYENIIYALKPGEASAPYRTKKAVHVFKVLDERNSAGKWRVTQILFSFPPDPTPEIKQRTKAKADSVYNLIMKGADFSQMVEGFSDDKMTASSKGELPEFGTGKYSFDFEKPVFSLKKDGDVSQPFETAYGYHIVKRLAQTAAPVDKADAGNAFELRQKVLLDSRYSLEKEKFAKAILPLVGYKKSATITEADLWRYADSAMSNPLAIRSDAYPISSKTLITFKKGDLKFSDWVRFVREYKNNPQLYKGENNAQLWDRYITISALNYYKQHLEEYNPEFRFQMQEFKEGNMLFEVMERNVWNKAVVDTVGLLKLYNQNKANYKWAESADVILFNANNEQMANHAIEDLRKGESWRHISEGHPDAIQADSGRYELAQIVGIDKTPNPSPGLIGPVIKNQDGTAVFVQYIKRYPADMQRNFEDARGLVINDYQVELEKRWLAVLKKKYPVKVNETVFRELLR